MSRYLRNIDLNLLAIFSALMHEKNLSNAADNLGMSQPAVSQALKRLRAIYNDSLFERRQGKMMPTLKAESIAPVIEDMLNNVSMTLPDDGKFDSSEAQNNFHINIVGVESSFLLTNLASKVANLAPNSSLTISTDILIEPAKALRHKEYDLYLDYVTIESNDCYHDALFKDSMFILARKDHPRLNQQTLLTLDAFLAEKHAVLRPRANNIYPVQYALKELALDRDIKYTSNNFENIVEIISVTDYIAIVPGIILGSIKNLGQYQWFSPPFELTPSKAFMHWHWSMEHVKSHRWLRKLLKDICADYQANSLLSTTGQ